MSPITRAWLAFAAIGAGLIHVALVIGAPPALGVGLAALGLVEFGWGVLAFARSSAPAPRIALVCAIVPVLVWAMLLGIAGASGQPALAPVPLLPLAIAAVFELFIAAVLGASLRRGDAPTHPPSPGRYLLGLAGGALAVTALVAPALAAAQSGAPAVPGGDRTGLFELPDHGRH